MKNIIFIKIFCKNFFKYLVAKKKKEILVFYNKKIKNITKFKFLRKLEKFIKN